MWEIVFVCVFLLWLLFMERDSTEGMYGWNPPTSVWTPAGDDFNVIEEVGETTPIDSISTRVDQGPMYPDPVAIEAGRPLPDATVDEAITLRAKYQGLTDARAQRNYLTRTRNFDASRYLFEDVLRNNEFIRDPFYRDQAELDMVPKKKSRVESKLYFGGYQD